MGKVIADISSGIVSHGVYGNEDNILEQKYVKQIFKGLQFRSDKWKCIIKEIKHITIRNSKNWAFSSTVVFAYIFVKCYSMKNITKTIQTYLV